MKFLSIAHSDVGIKKNINQDSILVKEAITDAGQVLLALVCDGMGGLAKGEVASATLVRAFSCWFEEKLPFMIYDSDGTTKEIDYNELQREWNSLIDSVNHKIENYGVSFHAPCGTTVVALLLIGNTYYIVNVGDSRAYLVNNQFNQLTKDHTFVQREIDEGRLTKEEAKTHVERSVLLQCVGASKIIVPDFFRGSFQSGDLFMLCSDGFRHAIEEEEFLKILDPSKLTTEKAMQDAAVYCTELNKQRKENDNISVIMIKIE